MATMAPRHGLILFALVFVCLFGFAGAMNPTPEHDNGHGEIQITEHEIDAYVEGNTVDIDSAHRRGSRTAACGPWSLTARSASY